MNKAWVWLVVLVIVAGIVAFFATRGAEEEGEDNGPDARMMQIDESDLKFGERTYDGICLLLSRQDSERGRLERMQRTAAVVGYGTVLSVGPPEGGLLAFEVDADPPDGQVEVRVDVEADRYRGEVPSAGEYVRYVGRMTDWEWHTETGKVELWLEKGYLSPAKGN